MLTRLYVQNYALIDRLELTLSPGLHLLTGETGAGKSLLVGAIGLILGERADPSVLLLPDEKCVVEAELSGPWPDEVRTILADEGLDPTPPLLIRREIAPSGRSRAFVNDTPVVLERLRALTSQLIDLHGQHDGQLLLEPAEQLAALDRYVGAGDAARAFGQQLGRYQEVVRERDALAAAQAEAARQLDYLTYQLTELAEAALQPGEDETLEAELKLQQHAEQIAQGLGALVQTLGDDELGLATRLAVATKEAEKLAQLDRRIQGPLSTLTDARHLLEEASAELQRLAEIAELDPERLAELHARADTLNRLKLKYQCRSVDQLRARQAELEAQVATLGSADARIADLAQQAEGLAAELTELGLALEAQRAAAAAALGPSVTEVLRTIGLDKATFAVEVTRLVHPEGLLVVGTDRIRPQKTGLNAISFRIQTNPGSPLGPLEQIASGGEISRVMLALKRALAERVGLSTLIFDEIDTGISGEVALRVGKLLEGLGQRHQLLVITHLPQIASRPGTHYQLYKEVLEGRTYTRLKALTLEAREQVVAEMLSGANPSAAALASARELLSQGG